MNHGIIATQHGGAFLDRPSRIAHIDAALDPNFVDGSPLSEDPNTIPDYEGLCSTYLYDQHPSKLRMIYESTRDGDKTYTIDRYVDDNEMLGGNHFPRIDYPWRMLPFLVVARFRCEFDLPFPLDVQAGLYEVHAGLLAATVYRVDNAMPYWVVTQAGGVYTDANHFVVAMAAGGGPNNRNLWARAAGAVSRRNAEGADRGLGRGEGRDVLSLPTSAFTLRPKLGRSIPGLPFFLPGGKLLECPRTAQVV